MSEKLIIKNFGPIKDIELDLRKVNVFIGDQGTGKSTVAKVLTAIYRIGDTGGLINKERFASNVINHLNKLFELQNYFSKKTFILFQNKDFTFKYNQGLVTIERPSKIIDLELFELYSSFYIPAERNSLHIISSSIFDLIDSKISIPSYYLQFAQRILNIKNNQLTFDFNDVLSIQYDFSEGIDKIILLNKRRIKLSEASSAIQSVSPLLIYLSNQYKVNKRLSKSAIQPKRLVAIEEPELNLFPETQSRLMKYLVESIQGRLNDVRQKTVIATHSPYILTSLNNLMYSYTVGMMKGKSRKVMNIVEKRYWLNPNEVSAYMMLPNGKCVDIMEREGEHNGLIKAEMIDGVSSELNVEFDQLLKLEHNF